MSKTNKKYAQRPISRQLSVIALLSLLLPWEPLPVNGQNLGAYGAEMCVELGISADECTLSGPSRAEATPAAAGDKTATLAEHGRRVCEQEGVPLEDCKALPASLRKAEETILPASSFLTVPATIPVVDPALVPMTAPAPVIADAPPPAGQQGVRYVRPQVPPSGPPLPYAAPPVVTDYRYLEPAPRVEPGLRYAEPTLPAADVGFRDALPPIEPPRRAFRERQPAEPIVRYIEPPAPIIERQERIGRWERFREVERSGRCLRAVRYSRPPSYRYVTC